MFEYNLDIVLTRVDPDEVDSQDELMVSMLPGEWSVESNVPLCSKRDHHQYGAGEEDFF